MNTNIQHATDEHVEGIVELENALFENAFGPGVIRQELKEGWGLVALEREKVVGYAIVRPNPLVHDLLRLGVDPAYQRRGIGRALLRRARELFRGSMMLLVRKNNRNALDLYQSEGFAIVGQSEESWLMRTQSRTD